MGWMVCQGQISEKFRLGFFMEWVEDPVNASVSKAMSTSDLDGTLASIPSHNITCIPFAGGVVANIANHQSPIKWREARSEGSQKLIVLIQLNMRSKITVELHNAASTTKHPMQQGDFLFSPPLYTVLLPGLNNCPFLHCILWFGRKRKMSHEPYRYVSCGLWGFRGRRASDYLRGVQEYLY